MGFFSFIVGIAIGVIGAWWFFERRDARSRLDMEAGWKKKLEHVEAEVRRADAAHDETKERLRLLQQERLAPPPAQPEPALPEPSGEAAADTPPPPTLAEPPPATEPPPADAPPPPPAAELPPTELPPAEPPTAPLPEALPPEVPALEPVPPVADAPEQPQSEADRIAQARRRIDAKLAQLPAGSSARQGLLAERAALDDAGAEGPATPVPPMPAPEETPLFTAPAEEPDDLELIKGIGPVLKERLNKLGITTFAQIAAFTEEDLARIDEVLDFKGRIVRERWIEQAQELRDAGREDASPRAADPK